MFDQFPFAPFYFCVAALVTLLLCIFLRKFASSIGFADRPDGRKQHEFDTPPIGGIAVFVGVTVVIFFGTAPLTDFFLITWAIGSGYLALGVLDDRFDINAHVKLLVQILLAGIFVVSTSSAVIPLDVQIDFQQSTAHEYLAVLITIVVALGIINAINMADGCDGLAAGLIIIPLSSISFYGVPVFQDQFYIVCFTVVICLLVFLFFNLSRNKNIKIFLGDGGSLFLGFFIVATFSKFAGQNKSIEPSIVLWTVAVPMFDLVAVVCRRIVQQKNIMKADRGHLHHYFLRCGLSSGQTTVTILSFALSLLCVGVFFTLEYPTWGLACFFILCLVYVLLRILVDRPN